MVGGEKLTVLIYKTEITESQNGHRLVLPANVRALVDDARAFELSVVEEGGKRRLILEPKKEG